MGSRYLLSGSQLGMLISLSKVDPSAANNVLNAIVESQKVFNSQEDLRDDIKTVTSVMRRYSETMVSDDDEMYMESLREDIGLNNKIKDSYVDQYGIDSLPMLRDAQVSGADVFLTTNLSVLEDRELLEKEFDVTIRTPQEMLSEQEISA